MKYKQFKENIGKLNIRINFPWKEWLHVNWINVK